MDRQCCGSGIRPSIPITCSGDAPGTLRNNRLEIDHTSRRILRRESARKRRPLQGCFPHLALRRIGRRGDNRRFFSGAIRPSAPSSMKRLQIVSRLRSAGRGYHCGYSTRNQCSRAPTCRLAARMGSLAVTPKGRSPRTLRGICCGRPG